MTTYLPRTLTKWTEDGLSAILKASTQDAFDKAFDGFLSQDVDITVNGCPMSRDDYKTQLQSQGALNQVSAAVNFDASIEVPDNQDMPKVFGLVSIFFDDLVVETTAVNGQHFKHRVTSALNVTIKQDDTLELPDNPEWRIYFDARRVSVLNQVFTDNQVPINT